MAAGIRKMRTGFHFVKLLSCFSIAGAIHLRIILLHLLFSIPPAAPTESQNFLILGLHVP